MDTTTHVFQVGGMHCGSCAMLIDDALEDLPGVRNTQTTMKHQRSTVELDRTLTSTQDVIAAIEGLGYQVVEL
ncbi:Copper chaperone CopZ [Lentzea albidocapillata subsp. violacea]|uniref:Copper chaperone CopZ n=1 Tax=Lentzea albidocapillata subsp. violacea TaxID=128104 RepID=A0A1G9WU51_9PSEU|nr:heavy-metal-associated domain-containing protein [Lentzea albidocapillata]SDM87653.1 Copper chaperone CopZ [Lentzea albidocapillata subsp. violacea]